MSQSSYQVPTGGSVSMVTFAGLMNGAYNALATQSAGASAPANGPSSLPQEFQTWFNTTNVNFPVLNVYDGAAWDKVGVLDVANTNWLPKMGGGMATLASGATVDIGASPQSFITITGTTAITSLGTAATVGEERKLQFSSTLTLTYGALAIVTPGLASITTQPGDCCTAIYQGSGVWVVWGYTRGLNLPGFSLPTGGVFWMPTKNLAVTGAVKANGLTIGSASSGATELASATTSGLFSYLWTNFSNTLCPVSGGRGASAAADFAANKTIGLPDLRGMVLAGLDDMGNSAASRLTSLTMTPDGTTALATGGAQVVTLAGANLPAYTPAGTNAITDPGHKHLLVSTNTAAGTSVSSSNQINVSTVYGVGDTNNYAFAASATAATLGLSSSSTTSITSAFTGTAQGGISTAVDKMQPTTLGTYYIVL